MCIIKIQWAKQTSHNVNSFRKGTNNNKSKPVKAIGKTCEKKSEREKILCDIKRKARREKWNMKRLIHNYGRKAKKNAFNWNNFMVFLFSSALVCPSHSLSLFSVIDLILPMQPICMTCNHKIAHLIVSSNWLWKDDSSKRQNTQLVPRALYDNRC